MAQVYLVHGADRSVWSGCFLNLYFAMQVLNELEVTIDLYYKPDKGPDREHVITLQPNMRASLPFKVVYSAASRLFFHPRTEDFTMSLDSAEFRSFKNKDTKEICCTPPATKQSKRNFYISVHGEYTSAFFEQTTIQKDVCLTLRLGPTLQLHNVLPYHINYKAEVGRRCLFLICLVFSFFFFISLHRQ